MGRLTRTVHLESSFAWEPLSVLAPDLDLHAAGGNGKGEAPMGLCFLDGDGDSHVFVLSDEGRTRLIRRLTGGIVVPEH